MLPRKSSHLMILVNGREMPPVGRTPGGQESWENASFFSSLLNGGWNMKARNSTILIFSLLFLLASCEENGEMPEKDSGIPVDFQGLSIDSLEILQTNIPEGLYTDLTFVSETTGFAISNSGDIVKTNDGGLSWEKLSSPADFFLNRIQFVDSETGYIVGGDDTGGYLLKTMDAGQNWELFNLETPDNVMPTGLFFLNDTTGYISGERLFRKTIDGGRTWSEVIDHVSGNIRDVAFKSANEGYAATDDGKYWKSVDGGTNWQSMQVNTTDHLKRIYFAEEKVLAKCLTNAFVDLEIGERVCAVPEGAFNFLFLDDTRCIGIGQHYEGEYLPYGDVFLTNDAWRTFVWKKYSPQSEALNITAIAAVKKGKVLMIGSGTVNMSVIELRY